MERDNHGFTLPELLITLALIAILTHSAMAGFQHLYHREQVTAGINGLRGLLHRGRYEAMGGPWPTVVCINGTDCRKKTGSGGLFAFSDQNGDRRQEQGEPIVGKLELPKDMTVIWRSWRGKPWLEYRTNGLSWYQNGHFLLCRGDAAWKLVLNQVGRIYLEEGDSANCPRHH